MNKRKLFVASALLVAAAVISGAVMTGVFTQDDADSDGPTVSTTEIQTASTQNADQYGLLNQWQQAYNGTGSHDYTFNGSVSDVTNECGNCHMSKGDSTKHSPPLHPIGLNSTDTGGWFFDDDTHRGPNTQLASQQAGIQAKGSTVDCGDCHTPQNASGFADNANSEKTSDPHSVHNDVMTREGCIRCHNYDDVTFSGDITFTQSNATRDTYGIANPINMTRVWDGKFLSLTSEAKYNASLSTSSNGWNKYGTADNGSSTQYSCGDCHGLYHDAGGLGFTFDDAASSRKGPYALVNDTNSIGISSGGNNFTCGDCHVTDAHAVHTNGKMVSALNWTEANSTTAGASHDADARGAEYCDECHSQNIVRIEGVHSDTQAADKLGLNGTSKDNLPDALASDSGYGTSDSDCGFCHD